MINKGKPRIIVYAIVALLGIILVIRLMSNKDSTKNSVSGDDGGKIEVKDARQKTDLNYEFSVPLNNDNKEKVSEIKMSIESAEIRDEIIVQGKKVTSIKGRTFVILNLKIKNEFDQAIEVKTRNYFRLSVNGDEGNWLAPDIHNDPLEVQAISTKNTRVGFPVDETDGKFLLQVGEIAGEKQKVEINL